MGMWAYVHRRAINWASFVFDSIISLPVPYFLPYRRVPPPCTPLSLPSALFIHTNLFLHLLSHPFLTHTSSTSNVPLSVLLLQPYIPFFTPPLQFHIFCPMLPLTSLPLKPLLHRLLSVRLTLLVLLGSSCPRRTPLPPQPVPPPHTAAAPYPLKVLFILGQNFQKESLPRGSWSGGDWDFSLLFYMCTFVFFMRITITVRLCGGNITTFKVLVLGRVFLLLRVVRLGHLSSVIHVLVSYVFCYFHRSFIYVTRRQC